MSSHLINCLCFSQIDRNQKPGITSQTYIKRTSSNWMQKRITVRKSFEIIDKVRLSSLWKKIILWLLLGILLKNLWSKLQTFYLVFIMSKISFVLSHVPCGNISFYFCVWSTKGNPSSPEMTSITKRNVKDGTF